MRRVATTALLIGSLLAGGCGGSTPAGGDPGDKRLNELRADDVFAATPPGARAVEIQRNKAQYRKPGFSGGGWDGPSVVVTFHSSAPPEEVFGFYGDRAKAAGWRATASGAQGMTDRWAKTLSNGAPATLVLSRLQGTYYRLAGSAAPE